MIEKKMRIYVAGIGPGSAEDITPAVIKAVSESDVVVGYKYYFQFIEPYLRPDTECIDTGMKKERERAEKAFQFAEQGRIVCVISSGDAGIYGMASLIYEMKRERVSNVEIIPLPGISAFQKAASLLGAPMSHDFCVISLSDLMTPWSLIEKRILAAAEGDFVTAVYNPRSNDRYWQLYRLREIFLQKRNPQTVVGYVRQAGRPDQEIHVTTLQDFNPEQVDMLTVVIVGNSQSYEWEGHFITPRGYYRDPSNEGMNVGQSIMIRSFQTILGELHNPDVPLWKLWPSSASMVLSPRRMTILYERLFLPSGTPAPLYISNSVTCSRCLPALLIISIISPEVTSSSHTRLRSREIAGNFGSCLYFTSLSESPHISAISRHAI